ncbi:MAG: hypothetical protein RL417_2240 [Pseudomonadota bacterium]|jgi:tRNA nucleotidyltransferase/poly(A) polymerase
MIAVSPEHRDLLGAIDRAATERGVAVYVVGGVVRDLLRGHPIGEKDFDFLVVGDAAAFARGCVEFTGGTVREFPDFLTAKIVAPTSGAGLAEIDFASSRRETYARPGRLPLVAPGDLAADLARRDFTVNALALPVGVLGGVELDPTRLRQVTVDQHNGLNDLERGLVRILHRGSFLDDPTRIFRGCRYVARLQGSFESGTAAALEDGLRSGALKTISGFRIVTELKKMIVESDFVGAFRELERVGVLESLCGVTVALGEDLERLRGVGVVSERRFEIFTRILFARSGARGPEVMSALGFGKKQIKHLEFDCGAGREELKSNHLTVPGLWFAMIRGLGDPEEIRGILRERGESV